MTLSASSRTLVMADNSCLAARTMAVFSPTDFEACCSVTVLSVSFCIVVPARSDNWQIHQVEL